MIRNFLRRKDRHPDAVAAIEPEVIPEARAAQTIGQMAQSDPRIIEIFGGALAGVDGQPVTIERALQVPAIFGAVRFLSDTMAALPMQVGQVEGNRIAPDPDHPMADLLNVAPNPELTAFDWRQGEFVSFFTQGRAVSFIERNKRDKVINFWPVNVNNLRVERRKGRRLYHYTENGDSVTYSAADVLDLVFMPGADGLSARSPIFNNASTIGLALAVSAYGARFFKNGGIPPFALQGPFQSPGALDRSADDMRRAVERSAAGESNTISVPDGHEIKALGVDPEKMQMVEVKKFLIEEFARIYNIPPVFLQDLSNGLVSNTEQQDLNLIKHTLMPLAVKYEQQTNLKLFGRARRGDNARSDFNALSRGDLKSRAEAIARQIHSGQITPDEARLDDGRPNMPGGNQLYIQGATVPLVNSGKDEGTGNEQES